MEQVIDEKKLIEILRQRYKKQEESIWGIEEVCQEINKIISIIEEQPQADKWIPCEVELPPKPRFSEDSYLVKTKCVTTPYTAYWNGEKWTDVLDDDIEDVIAWCPIHPYPQPYRKKVQSDV